MGTICGTENDQKDTAMMGEAKQKRLLQYDDNQSIDDPIAHQIVPAAGKKGLRCFAQINIKSFHHNVKQIKNMADKTGCDMIAVVKANAYGHGAPRICLEALKHGIYTFATATAIEGVELRQYSKLKDPKKVKIIVLGAAIEDEYTLYGEYHLDMMLSGPQMVESLLNWAEQRRDKYNIINVHCMMDTGMTRIGFQTDDALTGIANIHKNGIKNGIKFIGLSTHFADAPKEKYTLQQFDQFTNVLKTLDDQKINVEMFHCENSSSLMVDVLNDDIVKSYMDHDTKGFVRTGGAFYGHLPVDKSLHYQNLLPMISLYAQIRHIAVIKKGTSVGYSRSWIAEEDVYIATLSIGYADGYPRGMSNKKQVIRIHDHLYDIAGRVCMDMMMVNLGNIDKNPHIKDIKVGDYACLFGPKNEHEKNLFVGDMPASLGAQYNVLEITCGLTKRCPLVYAD